MLIAPIASRRAGDTWGIWLSAGMNLDTGEEEEVVEEEETRVRQM